MTRPYWLSDYPKRRSNASENRFNVDMRHSHDFRMPVGSSRGILLENPANDSAATCSGIATVQYLRHHTLLDAILDAPRARSMIGVDERPPG